MKTNLVKAFVREFPLIHVEMWGRRYASRFLGEMLPQIPIYVFLLKDGLVTAYRNPVGQAGIINPLIRTRLDNDPDFIDSFVKEKAPVLEKLVRVNASSDVSKEEFVAYLDDLFDYWQIHYISQFIPLDTERFSEVERNKALELRKTIDQVIHNSWNSITPILKRLFPELGDLVIYISWDELKMSNIPSSDELMKRKEIGVLLYNGTITTDSELKKLQEEKDFNVEWENEVADVTEFKGDIACKGKVTGCVRLILKSEDMVRFKDGEVLVSYMTMPAFMPVMHKAAAFITDEGGITSHAAIVARELKKPCIIGTKIATKVLKDGDMVEVDAENGIVKIIK